MDNFCNGTSPLYKVLKKSYTDIKDKRKKSYTDGTFENLVCRTFFTALAMRNEYAVNLLLECFDSIRSNKEIYRHEVKKCLKEAEKEKGRYCALTNRFAEDDEAMDYLDEQGERFADRIRNSYTTMYQTIRKEMTDKGVRNADFYARLEMCCIFLDTTIEVQESESKSESGMCGVLGDFNYMKLDRLRAKFRKMCDVIYRSYFTWDVNLNNEKCKTAYRGLLKAMRDYDYILSTFTHDGKDTDKDTD